MIRQDQVSSVNTGCTNEYRFLQITIVFVSWALAFFEYCFQVPANRIGFKANGGPYSLFQLKVIQEVITLVVFVLFARIFFSGETLTYNHAIAALLLVGAVYFAFR